MLHDLLQTDNQKQILAAFQNHTKLCQIRYISKIEAESLGMCLATSDFNFQGVKFIHDIFSKYPL